MCTWSRLICIMSIPLFFQPGCAVKKPSPQVVGNGPVIHQNLSDSSYILRVHNISVSIDPNAGGRIISLQLEGKEQLSQKSVHPKYYGSSLWLSPQSIYNKQLETLDISKYKGLIKNPYLYLQSEADKVNGFQIEKRFYGNTADTSIHIRYTITNVSDSTRWLAPWEVTRVPVDGLSFFPKGGDKPLLKSNLLIYDSAGIIWFPYDQSAITSSQKLFMDGSEGWLAHVKNRVIFIKQFPEIMHAQAAPGEEDVEIYANKEKTYIELENQGAYRRLLPSQSVTWEVKWYLRNLPGNIQVETGNAALINHVRKIIR